MNEEQEEENIYTPEKKLILENEKEILNFQTHLHKTTGS